MRRHCLVLPQESHVSLINFDKELTCDLITYSYRNEPRCAARVAHPVAEHLAFKSEFFGESLNILSKQLSDQDLTRKYDQFLILNGDLMCTSSAINRLLSLADEHALEWFQPSLTRNSFYSHAFTLQDRVVGHKPYRYESFCEVMCFSCPNRIIDLISEIPTLSISGWGIDKYLIPYLLLKGYPGRRIRAAIVDEVAVTHINPVSSNARVFSSGLTAAQEMAEIRRMILSNTLEEVASA